MFELFLLFLLFVICLHIYLDRFKMNIDMKNRKKTFKLRSMDDIIDYVTGEVSDLSDLSEDDEKSEETAILDHHQTTSGDTIPDESDVESNTTVEDDIDDEVFLQDVILTENGNVLKTYPLRKRNETKSKQEYLPRQINSDIHFQLECDSNECSVYTPVREYHLRMREGPKTVAVNGKEENVELVDDDTAICEKVDKLVDEAVTTRKRVYRWWKQDTNAKPKDFDGRFSDPPVVEKTPAGYSVMFFTDDLVNYIVENTNLYSVQVSGKTVGTTVEEIKTLIGIQMMMGIVRLPRYDSYWARGLRFPLISEKMSIKRFEKLRRYLHFVDNTTHDEQASDKSFKIRPVIQAVRNECIKTEPEEYHSVDEQIIPSKTKHSKVRQYNPKKNKKWGFKNLVRAGASGFMYDFYLYAGKE